MVPAGPAFASTISAITAAELGASYHDGCPVGPDALRKLTLSYWGFDDAPHTGAVVVAASFANDVVKVFHQLYDARFPLRSVRPISEFGGSDPESMAADNTSAFNCRYVLGTTTWSEHAYGRAIDINTVENPEVSGGVADPPAGAAYLDRSNVRPGMATPGSVVVKAFTSIGWIWGGTWKNSKDYQHFSSTGR